MPNPKISMTQLSETLKVSQTAIRKWKVKGLQIEKDGIDLIELASFLYQWKEEEADSSSSDASEEKKKWDAKRSQLKYLQESEVLIGKEEYLGVLIELMHNISSQILNLEQKTSSDFGFSPAQQKQFRRTLEDILLNLNSRLKESIPDWTSRINSSLPKE